MERKCSHHHNRLVCRNSRKERVPDSSRGSGAGASRTNTGKVRRMKVFVSPTTGGHLEVCVSQQETVRGLKQVLARKYRIAPARLHLLHKDRVLKDGTLQENEVTEGSRLVLCPNMESGTSSSRAEHSVIQALKNLSDAQIHDFLSGKSPLTLAIRLGEHLMFVQLQLSTAPSRSLSVQPSQPPSSSSSSSTTSSLPATSSTTGAGSPSPVNRGERPLLMPTISPVSVLKASQNLTEKLKELTQLTQQTLQAGVESPSMPPTPPPSPPPSPGAVIESMQHVGRGIYSGTFSGTLDPRLQDRNGLPRRDVNTILHILHDLLVAQPSNHIASRRHSNPSPSSPASPAEGGGEDAAMRDKVLQVQKMLELRRQRRLARRQNQRPYPSPSNHCHGPSSQSSLSTSSSFLSSDPSAPHTAPTTTTTTAAAATTATNHAENVETSNYRKPNMEQETVAV